MAKKKYVVSGNTPFMDHQPGEEFDAELTEEQEDLAFQAGAIKLAKDAKKEAASDA
jgi:hypothetical protein